MKKKIVLFSLFFILVIILITAALVFYSSKKININHRTIRINTNYSADYYNVKTGRVRVGSLLEYLLWNNDYKNIPVTENYIKNNESSISDKYGLTNYTGVIKEFGIDDDTLILDCGIYDGPYDEFILIKKQYYKYFLDENGLLDDIRFIREEVYREDDGTPIIRTNFRKFDDNSEYFNYFEYLVLGLDLIKLNAEIDINAIGGRNIENIEWKMKEYALTDNLKKHYDINQGIIPNELKSQAFKNKEIIVFSYVDNYYGNKDYKPFPKEKTMTVPIVLYYNYKEKSYYFNLSYSITDDNFLDSLELVEIQ